MINSVTEFYDRLSPVFRHSQGYDWEAGVCWEGEWLDRFLANQLGGREPWSVLDCSSGIGTQAIGLALHGHQVHATDLSPASVDCARRESTEFGVAMIFGVADFRKLGETISDTFDVVLSCDNSFAHCLHDDDLAAALASTERSSPEGYEVPGILLHDGLDLAVQLLALLDIDCGIGLFQKDIERFVAIMR